MTGTMTWGGFDVHARSSHAAAIDVMTGELSRMRFGCGFEAPVAWLGSLPGPVRACYEAGPTGFGFYRAAAAAGIGMEVVAPGKTPRGSSDRVKSDRKDAELLARLLLAGSLTPIAVASPAVEAARELVRAHDACRRDLMNARHREHRRWLSAQQFPESISELTYADLIACVDGLTARKKTLAERIGELATDPAWWPTVARLRAFRGVDTLTAFAIHLELGADWQRFQKAHRVGSWLGLTRRVSSRASLTGRERSRRPDRCSPAGCWSSPPVTTRANPGSARRSPTAKRGSLTMCCRSPTAASSLCTASTPGGAPAASRTT
jgi:transposase